MRKAGTSLPPVICKYSYRSEMTAFMSTGNFYQAILLKRHAIDLNGNQIGCTRL